MVNRERVSRPAEVRKNSVGECTADTEDDRRSSGDSEKLHLDGAVVKVAEGISGGESLVKLPLAN